MSLSIRGLSTVGLLAAIAAPAAAQQTNRVVSDLLADVNVVREKLAALAGAMPADKYGWRPGDGVRSVREVFLHVAADNYLLSTPVGVLPPPSTGINADDRSTVAAFEKRQLGKDAVIGELNDSFAHLQAAMTATPVAKMGEVVNRFGRSLTVQQWWMLAATHVHEHLGQAIAYARTNGVVPPWSQER